MLEFWNQYTPNLAGSVLDRLAASPLDVERALPNMKYGDLLVGSFAHGQIGDHRPFRGAGHYRGRGQKKGGAGAPPYSKIAR